MMKIYASDTESRSYPANSFKEISIENSVGDIELQASQEQFIKISFQKNDFEKNCSIDVKEAGAQLQVEIKKSGFFSRSKCDVDIAIQAPGSLQSDLNTGEGSIAIKGMKAQAKFSTGSGDVEIEGGLSQLSGDTGSGTIKIKGVEGDIKVNTGSGDVKLIAGHGSNEHAVKIKTGSGDISVDGIYHVVELKTGSGDVDFKLQKAVQKGSVDVVTGSGNTTIVLPETMKISSKLVSGNGQIESEIGSSGDADFKVNVTAGAGDLKIKKL